MMRNLIDLHVEHKTYRKWSSTVTVLEDFSLEVAQGEKVAIVGESGVGKSTLLNILGLIDKSFSGDYQLLGKRVVDLSDAERARWRNEKIGFVLQESALINSLSIAQNITLPLLYAAPEFRDRSRFDEIVQTLGISHITGKKPLECSGGEKARAVFARAIIMSPPLILADEPTASLDMDNSARMMRLLFRLNEDSGSTIVTVTHDASVAEQHDRMVRLKKGSA